MKYLKVMYGDASHANGFKYKIGEVNEADNWNPEADSPKEMGGFNYASEDVILRYLLRGDILYDVSIPSDADVVECSTENVANGVFRSNKIIVSNPRMLTEDIVMDLYLKSKLSEKTYFQCVNFLVYKYPCVARKIVIDHVNDSNVDSVIEEYAKYFKDESEHDNENYKMIERALREIKDKNLINLCVTRDPLEKIISNDRVINLTGQSGSGKSYYSRKYLNDGNYLVVDTDEIFSDKRFNETSGINKELGMMFREKYDMLPNLSDNFDLIYNDILDYCRRYNKTIVIDCAQFHCMKNLRNLRGKIIIMRTDINTCYERCLSRFRNNWPNATEEEFEKYAEKKKKIFIWYNGTNEFIKRIEKL